MLVDYDSLVNELSSVLSKCRLTTHRARVKALSTLLQGLLLLCEASLSGMGRGAALLDEQKTYPFTGVEKEHEKQDLIW